MPDANDEPSDPRPPQWAVRQAREQADAGDDGSVTMDRARQIAREAERLDVERHDEYDDPDEGGEG